MTKLIQLIGIILLLISCNSAFAQISISHVKGLTCAHSDHGDGACISSHQNGEAGGYNVDCEIKQGGTSKKHDDEDTGMSAPTWSSSSSSSITWTISANGTAPPNLWCVHHHGKYYDSDDDVFPGQSSPGPSCDVYGQ